MTIIECYREIFKDKDSTKRQNVIVIKEIVNEIVGPESTPVIAGTLAFGLDVGIRIGMKYKEMQQKEIEQEIKV